MPLLFALALRAAVPAGFMLAPDASGHLALVLCSGMGPMLPMGNIDASAHAHHHHHHSGTASSEAGDPDKGSTREADSLCPFAGSTGAALVPTIVAVPHTICDHIVVAAGKPASFSASTILRVQQARGPPLTA